MSGQGGQGRRQGRSGLLEAVASDSASVRSVFFDITSSDHQPEKSKGHKTCYSILACNVCSLIKSSSDGESSSEVVLGPLQTCFLVVFCHEGLIRTADMADSALDLVLRDSLPQLSSFPHLTPRADLAGPAPMNPARLSLAVLCLVVGAPLQLSLGGKLALSLTKFIIPKTPKPAA